MVEPAKNRRKLTEEEIEELLRESPFREQDASKKKRILFVAESNDSSSHGVPVVMNNIASVVGERDDYEVYFLVSPFDNEKLVLYGPDNYKEVFESRDGLIKQKKDFVESVDILHIHSPHLSDHFVYFNTKKYNSMKLTSFLGAFQKAKVVFTDHSNPTEDLDTITERLGINLNFIPQSRREQLFEDSRLKEYDSRLSCSDDQWKSGWTSTMILGRAQMYDLADVIVPVSRHQWEYNQWLVPGEHDHQKHQVVYNGIDLTRYAQNSSVDVLAEQLRVKYNLQKEDRVLLYAGRATEAKGFYDFLDAATILKSRFSRFNSKIKIILIGDAKNDEEDIKKRYKPLRDDMIFVGRVKERESIAALYKLADIVLQPTRGECFNQVAGEALAMGVPVITSDFSGPKEVYVDPGLAYGVKPNDPQALAEKIIEVLNNLRDARKMAKCSQKKVIDNLSIDAMGRQYLKIYHSLIESSKEEQEGKNVGSHSLTVLSTPEYQQALAFIRNGELSKARQELAKSRTKYVDNTSKREISHLEDIVRTIEECMNVQNMQKRLGNDPYQKKIVKHERRDTDGRELPLYGLFSVVDVDFMNTFAWKEIARVALDHYHKPWDAVRFTEYVHLITPSDVEASLIKAQAYVALKRPFEAAEEMLAVNPSELRRELKQRYKKITKDVIHEEKYLNSSTANALSTYIPLIERFLLQRKTSDSKAALYLISKLFNTKQDFTYAQKSRLFYLQGIGQEQVGDLDAAMDSLEQALTILPTKNEDETIYSRRLCDIECKYFAQKFKNNKKEVSYIMPVYNVRLDHLNAAIKSVLSQDSYQQRLELIIVDDGSKENLAAYIKKKYSQNVAEGTIKIVRKNNGGAADARNVALRIALHGGSKYITFFDADDIAHPQRTKKLVSFFEKYPSVGFVHAKINCIDQEGNAIPDSPVAYYFRDGWNVIGAGPLDTSTFDKLRAYSCPINNQSVMVRANVVKQAGFQHPLWRKGGEDMIYWLSIAQTGTQFGFLDEVVANYRVN